MANWEKLRGSWKYKNLNILTTKRVFLDEIKGIFHNYLRAVNSGDKNKKEQAQALSSFLIKILSNEWFSMPLCLHNLSMSMVWDCV